MKIVKKAIAILLVIAMLMSMLVTTAFAASNVSVEVDNKNVTVGDTIVVTVKNSAMKVSSFTSYIRFDKTQLKCTEIKGVKNNKENANAYLYDNDEEDNVKATAFSNVAEANDKGVVSAVFAGTSDVNYAAGTVFKATFIVKAAGNIAIALYEDSVGEDGNTAGAEEVSCGNLNVVSSAPTVAVTGVTLDKSTLSLDLKNNKTATLTATVSPDNATDKTVTWTSSAPGVATVDQNGTVAAVAEGKATITAKAGDKSASCEVTVVNCLHTQKQLVNAKDSTCTEKGWDAYYTCDCGVKLGSDGTTVIAAVPEKELAAHDFSKEDVTAEGALKTSGDCTKKAVYYKSCTVCGEVSHDDAYTFESEFGAHNLTKTDAKAATCTTAGNNEYWTCSTCHKVFKADKDTETTVANETIPAGHDYEYVSGTYATCCATGTKAHYTCKNCDTVFTTEKEETTENALVIPVDANKHTGSQTTQHNDTQHWYHCAGCNTNYDYANHSGGTATCTAQAKCTVCQAAYGDFAAHVARDTYAHDDSDHWQVCKDCGVMMGDKAAHNATGNNVATCTAAAVCDTCGTSFGAALGHEMTKTDAKAATCTENGNNEYYTCSRCKKVFKDKDGKTETTVAAETIAALGHKMTKTEAVAPTCTEAGNNEYYYCSVCESYFKDKDGVTPTKPDAEKVEPLGHDYGTQIAEVPATCTKEGTAAHYKCSRCEKLFLDTASGNAVTAESLVIEKVSHDYKGIYNETHHWTFCAVCGATTDKVAHDFAEDATTGTKACDCGYVVYGEDSVPCDQHDTKFIFDETHHWHVCKNCSYAEEKEAHSFGEWEIDVEATATSTGLKHRTCTECKYVQQEVIAKITTTPTTPSHRPGSSTGSATSSDKVQSSKTFDAGIATYVGLSILSLTGSALVIGKKKEF